MSDRRLIIVLGMHRSGTSLTTNLLHAFGLPLSGDLIEPNEFNARGYFESQEIARLQDGIFEALGMKWSSSDLLSMMPEGWWRSAAVRPLRERLATLAREELERHGGLWGFKDPRTARLFPMWSEIVGELDASVRFLLVSRRPEEVAQSLQARDRIDPFQAEVMWLVHNADAVTNTGARIDAIVDYQRWIDDPLEQAEYMIERLELPWRGTRAELQAILAAIVAPGLRRSVPSAATLRLPYTRPMYQALAARDLERLATLAANVNEARGFLRAVLQNASGDVLAEIDRELFKPRNQVTRTIARLTGLRRITTTPR